MEIQLTPGKVQDWVFVWRSEVASTDDAIRSLISRVIRQSLPRAVEDSEIAIRKVSSTQLRPGKTRQRREQNDPIPFLGQTRQPLWSRVTFGFRGHTTAVPWINERIAAGFPVGASLTDADLVLDSVGEPLADVPATPPEPSDPISRLLAGLQGAAGAVALVLILSALSKR